MLKEKKITLYSHNVKGTGDKKQNKTKIPYAKHIKWLWVLVREKISQMSEKSGSPTLPPPLLCAETGTGGKGQAPSPPLQLIWAITDLFVFNFF